MGGVAGYNTIISLFHIAISLLDRNGKKVNVVQEDKSEWLWKWPCTSVPSCSHTFCITYLVPPIFLFLDSGLPLSFPLAFCIQEKWRIPWFTPCLLSWPENLSSALCIRSDYQPASVMRGLEFGDKRQSSPP